MELKYIIGSFLLFVVFSEVIAKPQDLFFREDVFSEGTSCLTPKFENGICTRLGNCIDYYTESVKLNVKPSICLWDKETPIICCPTMRIKQQQVTLVQQLGKRSNSSCEEFSDGYRKLLEKEEPLFGTAVFNGRPTQLYGFPHMVRIGWTDLGKSVSWRLGGSLISLRHVLTAAHGVIGSPPTTIVAGTRFIFETNSTKEQPEYRDIQRVFIHPEYDPTSEHQQNDIAILSVTQPFVIQLNIRPACLFNAKPENGQKSIIIGFGQVQFAGPHSEQLLEGQVNILDNNECVKHFKNVVNSQLCAGDTENLTDTCQGDSGGPLMQIFKKNYHNYFYVTGITSYGGACGAGLPAVYTNVYYYLDWIESIIFA